MESNLIEWSELYSVKGVSTHLKQGFESSNPSDDSWLTMCG
jgi:hypothetical protein